MQRIILVALSALVIGALVGGWSVHTVYTERAVTNVQAVGGAFDRRGLRSVIRSELLRAKGRAA